MRIGIIGAGHIGGSLPGRPALAGHQATVSFSRDQAGLAALAERIGAAAGEPAEAAAAEVVVISIPWGGDRPGPRHRPVLAGPESSSTPPTSSAGAEPWT